ncbi:hypothetical protein MKZ38_006978 [Zalerion maritima]|uniref:Uncharacterized protein n=1 Tax=Zalerion maritima TaxID=339359 RepID=A0AAD5RIY9_9PEZI|nr:hypothetical protein MKZ38_006978 [Zalerion maritima]
MAIIKHNIDLLSRTARRPVIPPYIPWNERTSPSGTNFQPLRGSGAMIGFFVVVGVIVTLVLFRVIENNISVYLLYRRIVREYGLEGADEYAHDRARYLARDRHRRRIKSWELHHHHHTHSHTHEHNHIQHHQHQDSLCLTLHSPQQQYRNHLNGNRRSTPPVYIPFPLSDPHPRRSKHERALDRAYHKQCKKEQENRYRLFLAKQRERYPNYGTVKCEGWDENGKWIGKRIQPQPRSKTARAVKPAADKRGNDKAQAKETFKIRGWSYPPIPPAPAPTPVASTTAKPPPVAEIEETECTPLIPAGVAQNMQQHRHEQDGPPITTAITINTTDGGARERSRSLFSPDFLQNEVRVALEERFGKGDDEFILASWGGAVLEEFLLAGSFSELPQKLRRFV